MKFITAIILTALLTYAIGLFTNLPWYSFVFCAFIVSFAIPQKSWKAFVSGFVAVFLLWIVLVMIIDNANEHILSKKVAEILPLNGNYFLLILITGLIGGLLAGMSALTGCFLRKIK
ncbi:MAG: hypothetical protein LC122_05295 [Chitinophagales bacterium]|nr:hypothetical protein [Chitinophagales bacterium]